MKIIMVSNYFNLHQKALSDALYQKTGHRYLFIETSRMPQERRQMGWTSDYDVPYVRRGLAPEKVKALLAKSDVVIAGDAPRGLFRDRVRRRKLIFRYSERPLKKGNEWMKYLPRLARWHFYNPVFAPVYLLAASAYAPGDYGKFGLFRGKSYRWGYFPQIRTYEDLDEMIAQKKKNSILWCGRQLSFKHPEHALMIAQLLRRKGYTFTLDIAGPVGEETRRLVQAWKLEDCVRLHGPLPQEEVRRLMEQSAIFLFTSDFQEGWGAVMNESMNSACVPVASHAAGSVPYLVRNGQNGLVYHYGRIKEAASAVMKLLDDPGLQADLGREACRTITQEWNAQIAAERLIALSEQILFGVKSPDLYDSGPCSRAVSIGEEWF